jgi:hypothetical protein
MTGAERISFERMRQVTGEGYSDSHDDEHDEGSITGAALAYLTGDESRWPWRNEWKPSGDRVRDLTKAGALIAAEIDRLLRIDSAQPTPPTDQERYAAMLDQDRADTGGSDYIVRADESPIGPPEWRAGWVTGAAFWRDYISDVLTEWAAESERSKADIIAEGDRARIEAARQHSIAADTFRLAARLARGELASSPPDLREQLRNMLLADTETRDAELWTVVETLGLEREAAKEES